MAPIRVTLHVTVADPADLAVVVEAVERLGHRVECTSHDARERLRERDGFLLQALALMPGGTPRKKCRELAAAIMMCSKRSEPALSFFLRTKSFCWA